MTREPPRDPLAADCQTCAAGPGVLCPTATGLHWTRAKAAGMSPDEMLAWRPAEGRPATVAPPPAPLPEHPTGLEVAARALADLGIALAALETACDLAEQHGADVARLREIGRSLARADARRAS